MRPQGQRVPQAPFAAHGRFDFVFSAPVSRACSRPAARETVANPCSATLRRSPGSNLVEGRSHLDEVGSGAVINDNSTNSWTPPVVVLRNSGAPGVPARLDGRAARPSRIQTAILLRQPRRRP